MGANANPDPLAVDCNPRFTDQAVGDYEMTMSDRLDQLAEQGEGEISLGPEEGQDLEAFQATVSCLRDYEGQGYLIIVKPPHKDSRTGHRYVDRVRVRLTDKGIQWRKDLRKGL
jgi:hypothetical protein